VDESGAEAVLPHSSAGVQGVIQQLSLDRRLLGSMGCSDLDRKSCGAVAAAGLKVTIGTGTGIDPEEIVHSRYIVLWGTNTIVTNLHFWPFVREAQSRGARIVVVDPIRTRTAEAADWHLPIKPGSDAALALAIMHVIVRDDLVVSIKSIGAHALHKGCVAGAESAVSEHGRCGEVQEARRCRVCPAAQVNARQTANGAGSPVGYHAAGR